MIKRSVAGLCAALCLLALAEAQSSGAQAFKARVDKKTLYMRGFPTDLEVIYDSKGNPTTAFESGSWSYGQILVEKVDFGPGIITVSGKRVGQTYRGGWREKGTDEKQVLIINADPTTLPGDEANRLFDAIFMAEKDVAKTVVDEWIKRDAKGAPLFSQSSKILRVGGQVEPPRAIETGKGSAAEAKPRTGSPKFQGTVAIRAVISEHGEVVAVKLKDPLGMGLDEKAIRAVTAWTFEPARRNGKPVPVEINIEVNFTLD